MGLLAGSLRGLPPGAAGRLQLQAPGLLSELWGAAQAVESAALLVDDILPAVPIRQ